MAKQAFTSILEIQKKIKQKEFLPIYFFFGEDNFLINQTLKLIDESISSLITSDFDKVTLFGSSITFKEIIENCLAYPFGSEKKIVIIKELEKIDEDKDSSSFISYINSPANFTVLICIYEDEIQNLGKELLKALTANNFIYEAKELKEAALINWLISEAKLNEKILLPDNAKLLIDIVGENRNLLEMQLNKIFTFLGDKKEITFEIIREQAAETKEFTFFNLQDSIAVKNKENAFKIAFRLLESDGNAKETMPKLLGFLNKYFTGLAQIPEMNSLIKKNKLNEQAAARTVGTHPFYYKNYTAARNIYDNKKILEISQALLDADISIKTTSIDEKTILTILLNKILS